MSFTSESHRAKVLVIEDDPMVLELVTTRLELSGYRTYQARNGSEGLRRLADIRPDAVVLDINMPVMDGFEVLRLMQQHRVGAPPPTLVLTARNRPEDVKAAISLGARDFISKPFNDAQLIARVGRLLRKAPRSAEQPPPSSALPQVLDS